MEIQTQSSELALELTHISMEVVRFLESVTWGTDGALYQLQDYEPTLRHVPNPQFLTLRHRDRLLGVRLLISKQTPWRGEELNGLYHGLFAIKDTEKGRGYGKRLALRTLEIGRQEIGSRGIIYCYIEAGNLKSLRIAQSLNYREIGGFYATAFSRFFPKKSACAVRMSHQQTSNVKDQLTRCYAGHTLTDFTSSLRPDDYFLLMDRDRVIAGLQAEPQRWKIQALSGAGGQIAMKVLPHIPLVRDLFNPNDFHFLKLGNLFFEEGCASAAMELIEAVLAEHGLKTAMMFWDKRSPVYQQLSSGGSFGILNVLMETPVKVMARFEGFKEQEIQDFSRQPLAISPIDL